MVQTCELKTKYQENLVILKHLKFIFCLSGFHRRFYDLQSWKSLLGPYNTIETVTITRQAHIMLTVVQLEQFVEIAAWRPHNY